MDDQWLFAGTISSNTVDGVRDMALPKLDNLTWTLRVDGDVLVMCIVKLEG